MDDVTFLLDGVSEVASPDGLGPLCVYGPEAFPVIAGSPPAAGGEDGVPAPVVAAGSWQSGRIVAFGQELYLYPQVIDTADTARLLVNAFAWAAGGAGTARIGVVGAPRLHGWLNAAGLPAAVIALTPESLGQVDVAAVIPGDQTPREIETLAAFLRNGGGLVTAANGWDWAHRHLDLDLVTDYAGNRLLAPFGIQWSSDYLAGAAGGRYAVDGPPPALTHAGVALDAIEAHLAGNPPPRDESEIAQAVHSVTRATGCLPPDDTLFRPRLAAVTENADLEQGWPSAERPVGGTNLIHRLLSTLFVIEHRRAPAESVRAHPAAADFPGRVPAGAPRITRTVSVDTRVPRWHSTGLYAAPGERITVTMPASAAAAGGYAVRIGAHSDGIWGRPEWTRMPEITRRFPVSTPTTLAANAFGGLIYIEVPYRGDLGRIDVQISGAVAAPLFVLGETDPGAWRDEIRDAPAPWAEIAGRNMIVTTDAREVRRLDDPTAVAETWDRILDLAAELAAWSDLRESPERFVVDRQISVGYMHAGYPIMAHLDQQANLVNARHLRSEGNWGFFHEVGHNHQNYDWTFDTLEVTVNLFTLYVYERLVGIPVTSQWKGTHRSRAELMARYDFTNPNFDQWKREPMLALVMYAQMQEAFGWDAYRQVFETYLELPPDERPRTDAEKRDQWLVRFSRTVGRNLGPFFEAWGVPTSEAARDSISELPDWMPRGFPPS